ncbi:polyprotein [Sesbania bispinosa]|nr:polyprotein [Sesbania bispinosa]
MELLNKLKINEWLKFHKESKIPDVKEAEKEALFLPEKQKIMAELASATSQQEFEERSKKVRSVQDVNAQEESDERTSQSNPYLRNEDMFD